MALHPQTQMALGTLLQRLAGNPKTRQTTLQMVKELDPSYRLPADVQMEQFKAEQKKERAEEKAKADAEARAARRANGRKRMVDAYGEDTVKAIEEGPLKKYTNLSWDDAAKIYQQENRDTITPNGQPKPERFRHGQLWELPVPEGSTAEAFLANPEKVAQDTAYSMLDHFRAGGRP
jgi:hypothetical protein